MKALHLILSCVSVPLAPTFLISSLMLCMYILFGLPLFLFPGGIISSILCLTYVSSLLLTWPYHRSPRSLACSPRLLVPNICLTSSFCTLCTRVSPYENLSIFIPATRILPSWAFVIGAVSIPYSMAVLTYV